MKVFSYCVVALTLIVADGYAEWTPVESNSVAKLILEVSAMDTQDDLDINQSYSVAYTNWDGLVDRIEIAGWSRYAKSAAVDNFMAGYATNDCRNLQPEIRNLLHAGLCEYRDLRHTNALPILRTWIQNPYSFERGTAIDLTYLWAPIDDLWIAQTECLLTNTCPLTVSERLDTLWGAIGSIGRYTPHDSSGISVRSRTISLLYRHRRCEPKAAVSLDSFFSREITGYSMSSNRLQFAIWALNTQTCEAPARRELSALTNSILSSGQPLQQLTIEGAGE